MLKRLIVVSLFFSLNSQADTSILNVSYDVTREFYKDYNQAFIKHWKQKSGENTPVPSTQPQKTQGITMKESPFLMRLKASGHGDGVCESCSS